MRRSTRLAAILTAGILALSTAACGDEDDPADEPSTGGDPTTSELGRSGAQAADSTTQIAHSAVEVANAAKASSDGAVETQQAARRLAGMADELQALVRHFHVEAPTA